MMAIDAKKLAKVLALMDSPNPGERDAARERAGAILKAAGKTWRDLPAILGTPPVAPVAAATPVFTDVMRGFDDYMEEKEPGWKAKRAAEQAQKAREQADYRAAVIAKYGSEETALEPIEIECTVDAAVAPFVREVLKEYSDGSGNYRDATLDGWSHFLDGPTPAHVIAAVRAALPLPVTIAEAKAEVDAWCERDRDIEAIRGKGGDTWLSLGCNLRRDIVQAMLYRELRATNLADAIVRHRATAETGTYPSSEETAAMLADLEHLADLEAARTVQNEHQEPAPDSRVHIEHATATARRAEVLRLLSDENTAMLPNREIARRVGVAPATVGNLRRRTAAA